MKKKIVSRISNEIGNQLFIYASTYAIAKKLDRVLLIDDETSFKTKKNISIIIILFSIFLLYNFNMYLVT